MTCILFSQKFTEVFMEIKQFSSFEEAQAFAKENNKKVYVFKKITLNEILSGHKNNDDEIDDLCKTEKFNKQENHHIGFGG